MHILILILSTALSYTPMSWAADGKDPQSMTEAQVPSQLPCKSCIGPSMYDELSASLKNQDSKKQESLEKMRKDPIRELVEVARYIEKAQEEMKTKNTCSKFADDGKIQKWGKYVIRELEHSDSSNLREGPWDLKILCPRYDSLKENELNGLWVVIMNGMAYKESTCDPKSQNSEAPNGTAIGLMMLHDGKEFRKGTRCKNGDGRSDERSIRCGMSMLNKQVGDGYRFFGSKGQTYWEVLIPDARPRKGHIMNGAQTIMSTIVSYPPCGASEVNKLQLLNKLGVAAQPVKSSSPKPRVATKN